MPLSFFFDQSEARSNLTEFAKRSLPNAVLLTEEGAIPWSGTLPCRVGDDFYGAPWVLYSSATPGALMLDLSVFSVKRSKSPKEAAATLTDLANSTDWAIFPWGGYFRYGMLGVIAGKHINAHVASEPIFQYSGAENFDQSYRALIGRRNLSPFAPTLWQAVAGESSPPFIVTFEYYEDAFEGAKLAFSIEGTFAERTGAPRLSVYRVMDYSTFEYFVNMANQVSVFDIFPSNLSLESCTKVRHMTDALDLAGALQHTPWFMVYNGGEIDTNHVLFGASEHSIAAQFTAKSAAVLDFVSYL